MLCSQSKKKKSSKMTRRRERGEVLEELEIPLDLLIEILKRLPVKSLARFKCVSKLWSSLIHSQGHLFPSPPRLFISLLVENKYELSSLSLESTSKSSTVFDLDMKMHGIGGDNMVALRGLILYNVCGDDACIYNPTTGQKVVLPTIKIYIAKENYIHYFDYSLGYDPVHDQYKIVCTVIVWSEKHRSWNGQHWILVLEAGSFWKKIEFDHPLSYMRLNSQMRQRVYINGVIYYLTYSSVYRRIAISFDVRSEVFNMIQVPSEVYEYVESWYLELIEYGGKPTIFDYKHLHDPSGLLNLWVLEDAGKWSKKSLVLQPCHMHFFQPQMSYDTGRFWNPKPYFGVIATTQKGEVIFKLKNLSYPYYIIYCDLHTNDVRRVDIRGISENPISENPFEFALMDTESIMHLKI